MSAVLQEAAAAQMLQQQAQLDSLCWVLADARRLISAVAAVEGYSPAKAALQVCTFMHLFTRFGLQLVMHLWTC